MPCNFVGRFKVGDNIVYNAEMLCSLARKNKDGLFNKLMVVQIGSIIEASLTEIIYRAQNFNREGVPQISKTDQEEIKGKKIDKFAIVIDILKKYSVLDSLRSDIYDDLHMIRKYRNKIHIQDNVRIDKSPTDEFDLFSEELLIQCLEINFEILSFLGTELKRPNHLDGYVQKIPIPVVI